MSNGNENLKKAFAARFIGKRGTIGEDRQRIRIAYVGTEPPPYEVSLTVMGLFIGFTVETDQNPSANDEKFPSDFTFEGNSTMVSYYKKEPDTAGPSSW